MKYRPSYHFQVTVTEPCPLCNTFVKSEELKKRERYIYTQGWITHERGCQACFDKRVSEALRAADKDKNFYGM